MKFKEFLANSLILQNAADMIGAPRSLAEEGYPLRREDVAWLSPYLTAHLKRNGDYVGGSRGGVRALGRLLRPARAP